MFKYNKVSNMHIKPLLFFQRGQHTGEDISDTVAETSIKWLTWFLAA